MSATLLYQNVEYQRDILMTTNFNRMSLLLTKDCPARMAASLSWNTPMNMHHPADAPADAFMKKYALQK